MKTIIGVMGPGNAPREILRIAFELGHAIALEKWVLLTGGRRAGVMHEASRGAKEAGGLTLGILPGHDIFGLSEYVDIPIFTGMGNARNVINIQTSRVVIACGTGLGTTSEIVLALKEGKSVALIKQTPEAAAFLESLTCPNLYPVNTVEEAIALVKEKV